jgi:ketosteroid isomerase-like protein
MNGEIGTSRNRALAAALGAILVLGAGDIASATTNPEDESAMEYQSVNAAVDNFYDALNVMFTGDGRAVKDAWSQSDDITYMGPSGEYLIGWDQIEGEWDKQTAAKLGGTVKPRDVHIVVNGDIAILNCIEAGENVVGGKVEAVNLRSSTVFRKESGAWKIIGHQTDLLGYMNPPS